MTEMIIYLGPKGSYTEIAAEKIANILGYKDIQTKMENSIIKVIESVDKNEGYIGVVPIENAIEGIVRETVDNLLRTASRITIGHETIIPISHCLISKSVDISSIKKIISIRQALAQCHRYIARNFDDVELIPATSTSEAVRQLTELPENYAAIGNHKAAEIYKLNILAREINDEKGNQTRFVVIGSFNSRPTGKDKTSIAVSLCNRPGSLVEVLNVFKENNINLSYIESRPSKRTFGEYTFFIDFDGHIEDENVKETMDKITPYVNFYRLLGSYPRYLNS